MILTIQCIVVCLIFTAIVLIPLYKDPLSQIMSYPTAIRKRVEGLPQYQGIIKSAEKKHIWKKIIAAIISTILLSLIAYFSGAKTFSSVFWHVFILFSSVNIYDLFVLDIWLFCHSKLSIIPGTEDMIDEYRNPWHHVRDAVIGTIFGIIIALISASYIYIIV